MSPNDLRRQNLHVLLEGKGAKSALARLISLSPASVTSMLNGTKPLDKEFCNSMCRALKLPENWFESERKSGDVPESVQKRLAPLPRGSATPAPVLNKSGAAAPAAATASDAAAVPAAAEAAPAASMPQTWPAGGTKVSKVLRLGGGAGAAAAPASGPVATNASASVPAPAAPAVVATAAPSAPTSSPVRTVARDQLGDVPPAPVSGFIVEGGLSPITEALIKTLAQKARAGVLSEDRAFEMLGSVRAL